ncbi:hypothetical protein ZIOFF_065994 [Zingiber officinale]|uniref:Uncharacterized protein n=1 Tax=Zingiber officinale TaxID=94328 RepID=A0A8J5KHI8_ZINOF|nr:hypothetical protein ZIOFF_065994 [Zingiber officinale]
MIQTVGSSKEHCSSFTPSGQLWHYRECLARKHLTDPISTLHELHYRASQAKATTNNIASFPLLLHRISLILSLISLFCCFAEREAKGYWREATGIKGPSGFGSGNTAEQVTEGIDASRLTVIVTSTFLFISSHFVYFHSGSSGIGVETARVLALRGAHVIIGARNLEAANAVKQNILNSIPSARIDIIQIELKLLSSLKYKQRWCHFLLTNLLLEKLKTTAKKTGIESCIVNLSSVAHVGPYNEGIKFDKLNDKKAYNDMMAYGQSNLANILHSNELARCWKVRRHCLLRMQQKKRKKWSIPHEKY